MISRGEAFRIGRLGKPHGVKGEISFQFDDDVFDRVDADYILVEIDGLLVPFFFEEYRFRSDDVALLTLEGIDTEEKASELTGCDVYFPRSLADNDDNGSISKAEIIGYNVIDASTGKNIGSITAVDDSTVNQLFDVNTGKGNVLIPASPELIKNIDRKGRAITISIPDGLLNL